LIREMLDAGGPIDSTEVLNSPLIQNLVSQQVTLRGQIAELSTTLGPRHPRMQELESQLGDLRRQIRDEAVKYARAAENDAAVAAEREQDLLANIDSLQNSVAESNRAEVELRALERDAKSQRDLLELLLGRYRDATAREDLDALPADARLISRAAPATEPYFPKTLATLLAAFLGSLVLSCGIVITLELVRSVNAYPGVGPLPTPVDRGAEPRFDAVERKKRQLEPVADDDVPERAEEPERAEKPERTEMAEAVPVDPALQQIQDEILARSQGEVAHTVLFTSVRKIGNLSDLAMRLARSLSANGRRVVVVDTELSGYQEDGGEGGETGLGDLLTGVTAFESAIQRDKRSRVHLIAAGEVSSDPLILLASDRLDAVLEALRHTYDVIVLLAPAVIRHGEARLLARRADQAVLLSNGTAGEATEQRAQDRLLDAGLVDVAMVKVDNDNDGSSLSAA
jgi:Mrp family chromosome partitioning ATPase